MQRFKVAAVQMNALKDDLQHNLDVHVRFIEEAAEAGCSLILFPELSTTAHYGDSEVVKFAETAGDGPIFALMKEEGIRYLDPLPVFEEAIARREAIFPPNVDGHFTALGYRRLAEAVASELAR